MSQYRYLKQWRKNPKWSFSCCLALLLSFSDLQGDISGLVETSASKEEIHAGDTEVPTIVSAVEDSEAVDCNLIRGHRKYQTQNKKTCHQGTQTEAILFTSVVHQTVTETGL